MTCEKFSNIVFNEIRNDLQDENYNLYCKTAIDKTENIIKQAKTLFDKLNEDEKKVFLKVLSLNIDNSLARFLSILDEFGGGYFDDGQQNDGHFELYYVSDNEREYKHRVDDGSLDLFLEMIEKSNLKN